MVSDLMKQIACLCFLATCVSYRKPFRAEDCTDREDFDPGGVGCVPDCKMPSMDHILDLGFWQCSHRPAPDCVCKEQYLRVANRTCVLPVDCPVRDCPKNEHFAKATTECELMCARPFIPPGCSIAPISKCVCNKSTYRNNNNVCVPLSNCTFDG